MIQTDTFDVIILGSGPGGEGAAMRAAKSGKRVAMVERHPMVGGGCTHWGTIPSKALRQQVHAFNQRRQLIGDVGSKYAHIPSYPELMRHAGSVIRRQVDLRQSFYDRNRVPIYSGHGRFVDGHTIEVLVDDVPTHHLRAEHIIIATGTRPWRPPGVDFNNPHIVDADTVLSMQFTPMSMTVYGAGVIGCEYASMFRGLGIKVNLVNTRDKLLAFLDEEIIDALGYHFRDQGITIRSQEEMASVEAVEDGVVLNLKSGKKVKSEVLLFAMGRTGNTENMNLEGIGIPLNSRGQIDVDEHYRTALPHIYAVGDVIGFPSLASAAYDQGRFAATHLVEGACSAHLAERIPTGIYTSPEISSIGATEQELTEQRVPYEVGHAQFKHLARAQIADATTGMLKILFHRETHAILGIHCFGDRASEIIHIGQAIMAQPAPNNAIDYFVNTTFNYPTMAEAYRVAALNGLNRLF